MEIKWLQPSYGRGGSTLGNPVKILFTVKPKGVRLNATITRLLKEAGTEYVKLGLDEARTVFVIHPVKEEQGAFRVTYSKNGGYISAAAAVDAYPEIATDKRRLLGEWNEELKAYVFSLNSELVFQT